MWSKESIIALLLRSDKAVEHALLRLYERQTTDEQASEMTSHQNGMGFSQWDAEMFSSFARQILKGHALSPKQLEVCRKLNKYGTPRLGKYARQLLECIPSEEQTR